mmetsp:Transcript_108023/g.211687  ORF Transcript_108023/g.211687 Transcript_108023/m.211687 type:complete len:290 (-) Transcript_108023:72-941(-)
MPPVLVRAGPCDKHLQVASGVPGGASGYADAAGASGQHLRAGVPGAQVVPGRAFHALLRAASRAAVVPREAADDPVAHVDNQARQLRDVRGAGVDLWARDPRLPGCDVGRAVLAVQGPRGVPVRLGSPSVHRRALLAQSGLHRATQQELGILLHRDAEHHLLQRDRRQEDAEHDRVAYGRRRGVVHVAQRQRRQIAPGGVGASAGGIAVAAAAAAVTAVAAAAAAGAAGARRHRRAHLGARIARVVGRGIPGAAGRQEGKQAAPEQTPHTPGSTACEPKAARWRPATHR